jgi:hypothetical protein
MDIVVLAGTLGVLQTDNDELDYNIGQISTGQNKLNYSIKYKIFQQYFLYSLYIFSLNISQIPTSPKLASSWLENTLQNEQNEEKKNFTWNTYETQQKIQIGKL